MGKDSTIEIGFVIPIFQKKYIADLINRIKEIGSKRKYVICIVNDGNPDLSRYLDKQVWPDQVELLNLKENKRFAGANNAGWRYLIDKFPSLKYLGSINDDTIPRDGWLDALVDALERYPRTGMATPIMETNEGWLGMRKDYATYKLNNVDLSLIRTRSNIKTDTFVPVAGGFCFLARRDALEEVDFFDERFQNSCEDVDLSLKLTSHNWRIVVSKDSRVYHYGGSSRYLKGACTDLARSHALLEEKWGDNLPISNTIRPKSDALIKEDMKTQLKESSHWAARWILDLYRYLKKGNRIFIQVIISIYRRLRTSLTWRNKARRLTQNPSGLRLNLGCGDHGLNGMLNCDYRPTGAADLVMDCSDLSRFDDKSVSLVYSYAFFEHLYRDQQLPLLNDCYRILNDDGVLVFLGIPDFEVVAKSYLERAPGLPGYGDEFDLYQVYRCTHGDPESFRGYWLEQLHKSLFDKKYVASLLSESKFKNMSVFNYCYPGENLPLNLGFVAWKKNRSKTLDEVMQLFRDLPDGHLDELLVALDGES